MRGAKLHRRHGTAARSKWRAHKLKRNIGKLERKSSNSIEEIGKGIKCPFPERIKKYD